MENKTSIKFVEKKDTFIKYYDYMSTYEKGAYNHYLEIMNSNVDSNENDKHKKLLMGCYLQYVQEKIIKKLTLIENENENDENKNDENIKNIDADFYQKVNELLLPKIKIPYILG